MRFYFSAWFPGNCPCVSFVCFQSVFSQRLCLSLLFQWGFHCLLIYLYSICGIFLSIPHGLLAASEFMQSDCDFRMVLLSCLCSWFSLLVFLLCLFTCRYVSRSYISFSISLHFFEECHEAWNYSCSILNEISLHKQSYEGLSPVACLFYWISALLHKSQG